MPLFKRLSFFQTPHPSSQQILFALLSGLMGHFSPHCCCITSPLTLSLQCILSLRIHPVPFPFLSNTVYRAIGVKTQGAQPRLHDCNPSNWLGTKAKLLQWPPGARRLPALLSTRHLCPHLLLFYSWVSQPPGLLVPSVFIRHTLASQTVSPRSVLAP